MLHPDEGMADAHIQAQLNFADTYAALAQAAAPKAGSSGVLAMLLV